MKRLPNAQLSLELQRGDEQREFLEVLKLFLEEAGNCFRMYITQLLLRYPPLVMVLWLAQFKSSGDEEAWFLKALAELPALHNYTDIMVVANSQPDRKDKYNHFMDNEIMVAPLAYSNVFVSEDKGIKEIAGRRTKILNRTKCHFCGSFEALESWLMQNAA